MRRDPFPLAELVILPGLDVLAGAVVVDCQRYG